MKKLTFFYLITSFLFINQVHADEINGRWLECPSKKGVTTFDYVNGKLKCGRSGYSVPRHQISTRYRSCLSDNSRYFLDGSVYNKRGFCAFNRSQLELVRSAYKWSSDKQEWEKYRPVKYGSIKDRRRVFAPCRVRLDKAYFFGYLLKHNNVTHCMIIHSSGTVVPVPHYDLLLLTQDYGVPIHDYYPGQGTEAFDLFHYPNMPTSSRQTLCMASNNTREIYAPGIVYDGKCVSHWNNQLFVDRNNGPGTPFGLR